MSRVPLLAATAGPLQGARYEITEEGILLGRDPECAVAIPDQGISRQHARLLYRSGEVWVQDAGSRNGVFVNGKRVTRPKSVGPGDKITLGDHAFTVEMSSEEQEHSVTAQVPASLKPAPNRNPSAAWIAGVGLLAVIVAVVVYFVLP